MTLSKPKQHAGEHPSNNIDVGCTQSKDEIVQDLTD